MFLFCKEKNNKNLTSSGTLLPRLSLWLLEGWPAAAAVGLQQLMKSWYIFFFQLPWLPERMLTQSKGMGDMIRQSAAVPANYSDAAIALFDDNAARPKTATAMINYYRALVRGGGMRRRCLFVFLLFLWALGPRRPRLGFGVLKDTFPIRWSPWARFLPVQLIRSAWQSAWHINFPRTRCVSPMTPDHYYAVVDRMLCMR